MQQVVNDKDWGFKLSFEVYLHVKRDLRGQGRQLLVYNRRKHLKPHGLAA